MMKMVSIKIRKNWKFLLLIALAFFNFFFLLSSFPVYDWDEAWYGVSAYEMIENNDFIVNRYLGEKDFFNTKPPLGLWFITLSYKIFGTNIFALRFFSALSGFLSIIIVYLFAKRLFGEKVGFFSGIFLALSRAFLDSHSGRTGDFDAMFSLIFLLVALTLTLEKENFLKFLLLGFLMGLGFLLKGFAFLQIAILIFVYYFLTRRDIFVNFKTFVVIGLFFILTISPWFIMRYMKDGFDFFKVMIERDFFGRAFGVVDERKDTNFLYIRVILVNNLFWIIFAFFTLIWKNKIFIKKNSNSITNLFSIELNEFLRKEIVWAYLIGSLLLPFLMRSKSSWYINSFYPLLAMMAAWFVVEIYNKYKLKYWLPFFIFFNWGTIWAYIILRPIKGWYIPENKIYQPMLVNFIKENKADYFFIDKELSILPSEAFVVTVLCRLKKVYYNYPPNSIVLIKNTFHNKTIEEVGDLIFSKAELITNTLDNKWFIIKIR